MAKKKKDDLEDNLNQGAPDDINEVDDNFGLPDIELTPLDRDDVDDGPTEVEEVINEVEEPEAEQEVAAQVSDEGAAEPTRDVSTGRVTEPYEEKNGGAGKIILIAIIIFAALGGGWYFGMYAPKQKAKAEVAKQEAETAKINAAAMAAETERQAELAAQATREAEMAVQNAEPEIGTVTAITDKTGRYYVVIGSFVDGDLAVDRGNALAKDGVNTSVLAATDAKRYYRLAINDFDSFAEAQDHANGEKGNYAGAWVLKY